MKKHHALIYAHPALTYTNRIRNPVKRGYAQQYLTALAFHDEVPKRPAGLSTMAAQAVEMNLRDLTRNDPHFWLGGEEANEK
jgi:hypothetical protein